MICIIGGNKGNCKVLEELVNKLPSLQLTGIYSDPGSLMEKLLEGNEPDLVFLDLDNLGFDIFGFIKELSAPPNIIMVSSSSQDALKAFDINVVDYLIKPVTFPRFYRAVDKVMKYYSHKQIINKADSQIFIKKGSSLIKLKISDIIYIEALENYVTLNTTTGKHLIHFTMKGIENQLPSGFFLRIHRSYIVNKSMIQAIRENLLEIIVGENVRSIPVGNSYKDSLLKEINLVNKK
jgi:DNA-binding LytR/AlgR family response regulator